MCYIISLFSEMQQAMQVFLSIFYLSKFRLFLENTMSSSLSPQPYN